jgi:hypothetical protein
MSDLLRVADCGTDRCLVAAKVKQRLSVSKRAAQKLDIERFNFKKLNVKKNRDSSVGIALGYGPDDCCSRVRFPVGAGNFSLHYRV